MFAEDREGEKIDIAETFTRQPAEAGWAVSFLMPEGRSMASQPQPAGDVRLVEAEARLVTAVHFSGR
nr:heme-binding protein [Rhodovulum sp. 12E13]